MIRRASLATLLLTVVSCSSEAPPPRSPAPSGAEPATAGREIALRGLSLHDGVLEGELFNPTEQTADRIVIGVSFRDAAGKELLAQELQPVPGGDGRALAPRSAKHFTYRLSLGGAAQGISVAGEVRRVERR